VHQNYPNPFNPTTTIALDIDKKQNVELTIFNLLGQEVKTLFAGELPAGTHIFEWNAADDNGDRVASGVYFYRVVTDELYATRKMLLLK
jgi:flagellar hook assembly protein FlgD